MDEKTEVSEILNVIRREGGFVDHPSDKGGPTKFGITIGTLGAYRGKECSREDVRSLTLEEAVKIYRALYASKLTWVEDGRLFGLALDFAVHSGVGRVIRILQEILNVPVDGQVGPVTRAAMRKADPLDLYLKLLAYRIRYLGGLIARSPSLSVFAKGWANRVADFVEGANR